MRALVVCPSRSACSAQRQVRQRAQGEIPYDVTVIEELMKIGCRLSILMCGQVSLPTDMDVIHRADGNLGGAGDGLEPTT